MTLLRICFMILPEVPVYMCHRKVRYIDWLHTYSHQYMHTHLRTYTDTRTRTETRMHALIHAYMQALMHANRHNEKRDIHTHVPRLRMSVSV